MTSYLPPQNHETSGMKNCTTASTFEKVKSLKFELLFGAFCNKLNRTQDSNEIFNAVDYSFSPGEIFGFACQSYGDDFRNFHFVFVLRACQPGQKGKIITGIAPGAEILVKTLTHANSLRLRAILVALSNSNISLSSISDDIYKKLDQLLEAKIYTGYFVDELIVAHQI